MSRAAPGAPGLRGRIAGLIPGSVAGQIALLVVAAIVVTHVIATVAFFLMREPWRPDDRPGVAATRLATVARLLDATPPEDRAALLKNAARMLPTLRIAPWSVGAAGLPPGDHVIDSPIVSRFRDGFGRPLALTELETGAAPEEGPDMIQLGVATPNGALLRATLPAEDRPQLRGWPIVFPFILIAITLSLLSVWATRALTAPLARLAEAAEAFGARMNVVALPDRGPKEVLAVSRALDRMRDRVRRLIDDRTQMLAAISHDLRTPITRLRLRAEFIEDEHARGMILRDLDQMNGLVEAALSFARDGGGGEAGASTLIDLASVVQTVCDGFADVGAEARVEQSRHVLVQGRPDELQRAIMNLVDNAVKYGGGARVRVGASALGVAVEVIDEGPGIPESEREAMLQPFTRGDRARNLNEASGFGLGLSIVLAIVKSHGGRLSLENRSPRGLVARIELPLAAARAAA